MTYFSMLASHAVQVVGNRISRDQFYNYIDYYQHSTVYAWKYAARREYHEEHSVAYTNILRLYDA